MSEAVAQRCQQAFIALLGETGYRQVRMAAVAERAGVSRPTLYRCFGTKEELFRATVDGLFEEFYDQAEPWLQHFDDSLAPRVNQVASLVAWRHRDLIRALVLAETEGLMVNQLRRYFARLLGTLLRQQPVAGMRTEDLDLVAAMMAGACFQGLREWVGNGMQQSPERLARILTHVFNGQLLTLLEPDPPSSVR